MKDGEGLSYTVNSAIIVLEGAEKGRMSSCLNSFGDVNPAFCTCYYLEGVGK